MQSIQFEKRAVAFIDVLGFKQVVASSQSGGKAHAELEELIYLLESAVPTLDKAVTPSVPKHLIPTHIYISDSIILSAPLTSSDLPGYDGLSVLVMRIIQIGQMMLSKGYLIRGGISIGPIWHTKSNIVGPAYQEAYAIETMTVVPRVELSGAAIHHWKLKAGHGNRMCIDYMGKCMVNVLHDFYVDASTYDTVEAAFGSYSNTIELNLTANVPEEVRYKWWWFRQYFKVEAERRG